MRRRKPLPTDRQILEAIYARYYDFYAEFDHRPNRRTKIYVPIDCEAVGRDLGVDGDIVFGRLYYVLDKKHAYKNDDGSLVALFSRAIEPKKQVVHFPLLASVLAEMRHEQERYMRATVLAVVGVVISVAAVAVALYATK